MASIILIDDDPLILKTMAFVLKGAGYDVHTTVSGKEGLEMLETIGAEVIISDVFMPDIDGIEVFMKAMTEFPQVKRILISGGGSNSDFRMLSISEGTLADEVLTKPVNAEALLRTVEKVLTEQAG